MQTQQANITILISTVTIRFKENRAREIFTSICRSWWGARAVRAVGAKRIAEAQFVWFGVVLYAVHAVVLVLVRADLIVWRASALPGLLVIIIVAAVGSGGDRKSRWFLGFVQTVVTAGGNLVWMHICTEAVKNSSHVFHNAKILKCKSNDWANP